MSNTPQNMNEELPSHFIGIKAFLGYGTMGRERVDLINAMWLSEGSSPLSSKGGGSKGCRSSWLPPAVVLEVCYKVFLEPSLLQAEQPQLSQPVFIGKVLQPSDHLHGPPLDLLQQVHVLLMLGAPELNAALQVVVESNKVSPQPPFLQAKQPQLPQPLLMTCSLGPSPASLPFSGHAPAPQCLSCSEGPKLNTVFEVRPHQCQPGYNLGTLLAHVQAAVNQHPQVFFCRAAFQPLFPKPVALHEVVVAQVQDPALSLVEPHTIGPSPSIQPVQVLLQSLPTLKQINTPTQLGVICKLTEGALDPFVQIIDKDVKQNWPQHRALWNTACDQPPTGFNSIDHHSLGVAI
ncbi:hypothetical protein QYF61_010486 [Mycteria americana]|uniref:Uncharacterized protein n=1 Tax=Mycteria americana TaxID=33587 RepID=A0AAN7MQ63_MYCAM|nr:hypothetical protein QYF61_010486 [Mycteria americana]